MSSNVTNQVSYLRTSRNFTNEIDELSTELNRTYIDIAQAVNSRTISTFPVNIPTITGENWFITQNQRQQSLRQVYGFTSTTSINHGLRFSNIERFVRGFGSYTDGTNWYGLIFGSNVPIAGQISFYITSTQIVFLSGAGAPSLTNGKGTVIIEWLSNV